MTENNGAISNGKRSKEVTQWVTKRLEGQDSVMLPALAHEAVEHFKKDEAFVEDIMTEILEPAIYNIAKHILGAGRPKSGAVLLGDELTSREAFERQAFNFQKRFAKWYEHAGDRHYKLMEMTRPQLLMAAEERRKRAHTELFVADFLTRLAENLADDQRVSDRYKQEKELEDVWNDVIDDEDDEDDEHNLEESA